MKTHSEMPLYNKALELLKDKVTLEALQEWEALLLKAKGEEADRLGTLWDALFAELDDIELTRWEEFIAQDLAEE